MIRFKPGDKVKALRDIIEGVVLEVNTAQVTIEDSDGFVRKYKPDELVYHAALELYAIDAVQEENRTVPRSGRSQKSKVEKSKLISIDLHIEELMDDHRTMSNTEIVACQMRHCRLFVENAMVKRWKKILIIHGKGEGVLRSAVHDYLDSIIKERGVCLEYLDGAQTLGATGGSTEVKFCGW